MSVVRRRRSQMGPVLSVLVVIVAGFGIAVVEAFQWPKATIWVVVAGAILAISAIRSLTRPRS